MLYEASTLKRYDEKVKKEVTWGDFSPSIQKLQGFQLGCLTVMLTPEKRVRELLNTIDKVAQGNPQKTFLEVRLGASYPQKDVVKALQSPVGQKKDSKKSYIANRNFSAFVIAIPQIGPPTGKPPEIPTCTSVEVAEDLNIEINYQPIPKAILEVLSSTKQVQGNVQVGKLVSTIEKEKMPLLKKEIKKTKRRFRYCYESWLRLHPNSTGEISFNLMIATSGKISKVDIINSSIEKDKRLQLETCLIKRIKRMDFPTMSKGYSLDIPIAFELK